MDSGKRKIQIQYEIIKKDSLFDAEDQQLIQSAEQAAETAYAPYSGFRVGAALLLEGGRIITGSNQENAAYPSGLCAERVAIFAAASRYPDKRMLKMAITAKNKKGQFTPVTPCGSCRQVMLEYERQQNRNISLLFPGPEQTILRFDSVNALLPLGFDKSQLI